MFLYPRPLHSRKNQKNPAPSTTLQRTKMPIKGEEAEQERGLEVIRSSSARRVGGLGVQSSIFSDPAEPEKEEKLLRRRRAELNSWSFCLFSGNLGKSVQQLVSLEAWFSKTLQKLSKCSLHIAVALRVLQSRKRCVVDRSIAEQEAKDCREQGKLGIAAALAALQQLVQVQSTIV